MIRTLLSCIPQSEIKQIYEPYAQESSTKHISPSKNDCSNISPTFNYVSFIRGFIINEMILKSQNIYYCKKIWLSTHNPESILSEQTIRIMNHLVEFIFKHCNLIMLEFPFTMKYSDIINLSQFIPLISLQKNLQYITLSEGILGTENISYSPAYYRNIFNLLTTQSESLQILEFKHLSISEIDYEALNSLCLLKNIRELRVHHCRGIINLNSWVKRLTNLELFEISISYGSHISEDFLIQLFQSSSDTLTKLVIMNFHLILLYPNKLLVIYIH